ncbi:gamma-glutamylcyclotransferase family protein [Flavobacterium caeni]|uniref:Gamma-glutamyl cyclotransferase, AIG2-like n=1 Tax=Flavobacterium caeni TaxID=490189 RepID=A0A1G5IWB9_9FLAO|nr:gamma-glutamylcyclotransferase family protein [Flavobacterium caeni]SCY80356.1 Gamma-glutamyl cyclotransferase, AIG2-like [Flavobacterium caeni]
MPLLFSYGTLQKPQVQTETFGRLLHGTPDVLIGYQLRYVEITDPEVLRKSQRQFHPIIAHTGNNADTVSGVLFEITDAELAQADRYEVDDYKRIEATFASGKIGFIYVEK